MNLEPLTEININKITDIADLPEKSIDEVNQNEEVLISLPKFFYEARDDINNTKIMQNIRVINMNDLMKLIQIGIRIENVDANGYDDLFHAILYEIKTDSETTSIYLEFATWIKEIVTDLEIKQEYDTFDSLGIEFDKIRMYKCNQHTKLLESFEDSSFNGKEFYSLLNQDEELLARTINNDTDYNRCQYVLSMFEKTYAFQPNRTYNKFTNYIMLTLFNLAILTQTHPLKGFCANDLFVHYMCVMLDTVIRSRHINVWLQKAYSNHFNLDYKPTKGNDYNKIYQLKTSKERFEQFASLLNDKTARNQKYEGYLKIINNNITTIENVNYYYFNLKYMIEILSSQPIQSFSKLFSQ